MSRYTAFFTERPLVALSLCYGMGVLLGFRMEWMPVWAAAGLLCGAAAAVILFLMKKSALPGVCLSILFLGILLGGAAANPSLPAEGRCTVYGTVSGSVRTDDSGKNKVYLEDVFLTDENGVSVKAGKAYLTLAPDTEGLVLEDGQVIRTEGRVYYPSGRENPYGFDFREYLLSKGCGYGITVTGDPVIAPERKTGVSGFFLRLRETMADRGREIFGSESALPLALILGIRDELPDETQSSFSDAGVAHILAVSGLHVSLLAGVLMLLLRKMHLSPLAILCVTGVFLLVYCALIGFSAPVVRASVLTMIVLFAPLAKRRTDPLTSLAAAFLILLLIRPADLFTQSFILSFSAVLGIILFGDLFKSFVPRNRILARLWSFWQTTFAASCGVALSSVCCFHSLSLIGFVINPFVCAFIGILLPAYAVIFAVGWVWLPAGRFLGTLIGFVTRTFTEAIDLISRVPGAVINVRTPPVLCMILLVAGMILLTRYSVIRRKIRLPAAGALILSSVLIFIFSRDTGLRYIQLSSGQADCAVITDGNETVVLDTGEDGGDLSSYLLSSGLSADTVVITHFHSDHTGGIKKLIENGVRIGKVYYAAGAQEHADDGSADFLELLRDAGIPVREISRGDVFSTERVRFSVLWPERGRQQPGADANDYSLAMMIDLDGTEMLHMGDLSGIYELYAANPADILKVAHHGSGSSTGEAFLSTVSPETALITAASFRTNLPNERTLERLRAAGAVIYRTDEDCAIEIRFENGSYTVNTYKRKR